MKKKVFMSVAAIIALIAGCAMAPQKINTPFEDTPFIQHMAQGSGTIKGQAFMKTRGGDVKFGAGNKVELVPLTPYIRERLDRATIKAENVEPRDPRVEKYVRTTVADGSGNFEFSNIPPGSYAVYCEISWLVPGAYGGNMTGGMAYATVTIKDAESIKVIVTR